MQKYTDAIEALGIDFAEPTPAQVDRILKPMQTPRERNLSTNSLLYNTAWLRTHYGLGTDVLHEKLLSKAEQGTFPDAVGGPAGILDNPDLYNFGADWALVFNRLPFLLTGEPDEGLIRTAQAEAVKDFHEDMDVFKENKREQEVPSHPNFSFAQVLSSIGFLFIADEKALRSGLLLLVWYDECGRATRQTRVEPEKVPEVCNGHLDGWLYDIDSELWGRAEVGEAYEEGGICGPPYPVDDPDESSDEDADIS